jgi:hypothetical protein
MDSKEPKRLELCRRSNVLLGHVDHGSERLWIMDRKRGKDFSVDFDIGLMEAVNQTAIAEPVLSCRRINADIPKAAKHPLFDSTIAVGINEPSLDGFSRLPILPATTSREAFCQFENLFVTPPGFEASLCSWHGKFPFVFTGME